MFKFNALNLFSRSKTKQFRLSDKMVHPISYAVYCLQCNVGKYSLKPNQTEPIQFRLVFTFRHQQNTNSQKWQTLWLNLCRFSCCIKSNACNIDKKLAQFTFDSTASLIYFPIYKEKTCTRCTIDCDGVLTSFCVAFFIDNEFRSYF